MRIDIHIRNLGPSESLQEFAARRVQAHLSRFAPEIRSVMLRLRDVNGPKGGIDKHCQIVVRGPRIGTIALDALLAEPHAALESCLERAAYTVGRSLERSRELSERRSAVKKAS